MTIKPISDAERKGAKFWMGGHTPCDLTNGGNPTEHDMTTFVDGKTQQGPWANMCLRCWSMYGIGRLGTGYGQKYEQRDVDGKTRWLKVAG